VERPCRRGGLSLVRFVTILWVDGYYRPSR